MLADHAEFYGVIRTIAEPGIPRGGLGLGGRFRAWSVERYFKKILKKDQGQAVFISALPATTWGERSGGVSPRGVPLTETVALPGTAVIEDGFLAPSDAPGFGIDLADAWLEKVTV